MRRMMSVLVLAGALGVAACSDSAETTGPGLEQARGGPPSDPTTTCTPNALRQSVADVFGNSSPEADLIKLITTTNAGTAFATSTGFQIITSVATLRAGTSWNPALAGAAATLTAQLFPCMNVTKTQPTTVASITAALGADGSYQLRGGADDPTGLRAFVERKGRHQESGAVGQLAGRAGALPGRTDHDLRHRNLRRHRL